MGASALDAWAELRDAEMRTYRLPADGVRGFSVRVRSRFLERLTERGGPLEGAELDVRLHWQDGLARATVAAWERAEPRAPGEIAAPVPRPVDPEMASRISGLVEPLAELLVPPPPTRTFRGYSFAFVGPEDRAGSAGSLLRPGERGIVATSRRRDDERERAVVAIGAGGVITAERHEWKSGPSSEFRHAHRLSQGRWLPLGFEGSWHGDPVAVALEWAEPSGARPLPSRLVVTQGGETHEFDLEQHAINPKMPPGLFPEREAPSLLR